MEPKPVRLMLAKDRDLDGNESSLEAVRTGFLSAFSLLKKSGNAGQFGYLER